MSIILFPLSIIIWSFLAGILLCYVLISPDELLPNLLFLHVRKKDKPKADDMALLKKFCPVCGKQKCKRHRPELNTIALHPWTDLEIPHKVDHALEEFLNLVLKEFIYTWYRDLSDDESFVDEIRGSLRFIISSLFRRIKKTDLPTFITSKVINSAIRHLHFYLQARRKLKTGQGVEDAALEFYDSHLHTAVRNRTAEQLYLKGLSEKLFPYLLPVQSLKCRSLTVLLREILSSAILLPIMDVIANPDIINHLLLIFFDPTPPPTSSEPVNKVNLLSNFVSSSSAKTKSNLHLELKDIIEDPENLFPFMQFMKSEASVNVLQFYLTVEELNKSILTPELSDIMVERLHEQVVKLYKTYFDSNSQENIHFTNDIVEDIKNVAEGPPSGVLKLQNTPPLFRAYDHVYNLLEKTFLPLFHQSDNYYQMLCGDRIISVRPRSNSRTSLSSTDSLTFSSKIGNKLKDVFKPVTIEGSKIESNTESVDSSTRAAVEEKHSLLESEDSCDRDFEDQLPLDVASSRVELHDLTAWRVMISDVIPLPEPENPKRTYYTYMITIHRVDVVIDGLSTSGWQVYRRYHEFYVLEQKLTEFHGEFEHVQLPPKKSFGTRNLEFLESRRIVFEQYLKKLLAVPKLKNSELLHNFLSSPDEFINSLIPDINLGKMVKSGAMKLVKEKGQHLEPFLQSFVTSTENLPPKPRAAHDMDSVSISSERISCSIFDNNANLETNCTEYETESGSEPGERKEIRGVFDALTYLTIHIFHSPGWLLNILSTVHLLFKNSIDTYIDYLIGYKIQQVSQQHRVEHLIHLLRDQLFYDNDPPRTEKEKILRQEETLKELRDFFPRLFPQAIGNQAFMEGTQLLFDAVQLPKLNKQFWRTLFWTR